MSTLSNTLYTMRLEKQPQTTNCSRTFMQPQTTEKQPQAIHTTAAPPDQGAIHLHALSTQRAVDITEGSYAL